MFEFFANAILYAIIFTFQPPYPISVLPEIQMMKETGPELIRPESLGIKITAPYAIVVDSMSGAILYEKNKLLQTPAASITKLMNVVVFLEHNPGWEKKVTIQKDDIRDGGFVVLLSGDTVKIRDLFYLTLISSSNEAAIALARSTGLTSAEFVEEMNGKAKKLGLKNTFFIDPSGLEPANISNAYEISKFALEAFRFTEIREAAQKETYHTTVLNTKRKVAVRNTDLLLSSFVNDPQHRYKIIGAKTGFLNESLYNFTAQVTKNNKSIIVVLLGSKTDSDRWDEAKGLIDWTFSSFRWRE